jgi:hypothetical protein
MTEKAETVFNLIEKVIDIKAARLESERIDNAEHVYWKDSSDAHANKARLESEFETLVATLFTSKA